MSPLKEHRVFSYSVQPGKLHLADIIKILCVSFLVSQSVWSRRKGQPTSIFGYPE